MMEAEEARKLARAMLEMQDEARDALLNTMGIVAYVEANRRLSPAGKEVLAMLEQSEHVDMSILEAYVESAAIDELPEDEQRVIEICLARIMMIEQFSTWEGA